MAEYALELDAAVTARGVALTARVPAGSTTAVVGPNAAGKSTLLQLVAGQLQPDAGHVRLAGQLVSSPARHVPTHRRWVAMLAQRPLLFPHLSVLENVAFGPRARGASRRTAEERARAELEAVDAGALAGRAPRELSGGQAQRVAIARALAIDPAVILLDEPFASLDVSVAAALRTLLGQRLRGRTALLVTHDALDLWTLADSVLLLQDGRVVDHGPVDALMGRPVTEFLANLGGLNRLAGTAASAEEVLLPGAGGEAADLHVWGAAEAAGPPPAGAAAMALFDPSAVALHVRQPEGSPRNVWPATVIELEPRGALVRVRLRLGGGQLLAADVTARSVAELGLLPGELRWASVKAAQVRVERRTGAATDDHMAPT